MNVIIPRTNKKLKITPISPKQYDLISGYGENETETVYYQGLIGTKCINHPEYGDVILIHE